MAIVYTELCFNVFGTIRREQRVEFYQVAKMINVLSISLAARQQFVIEDSRYLIVTYCIYYCVTVTNSEGEYNHIDYADIEQSISLHLEDG